MSDAEKSIAVSTLEELCKSQDPNVALSAAATLNSNEQRALDRQSASA